MAKKMGRPGSGARTRDVEVTFHLTPEDAQWFAEAANSLGFRSRGQFFTAVMERLRIGGLAPFAFLKIGYQLAKLAEARPSSQRGGFWNPFKERILPFDPAELLPPPVLGPASVELDPAEKKFIRDALRKQLV